MRNTVLCQAFALIAAYSCVTGLSATGSFQAENVVVRYGASTSLVLHEPVVVIFTVENKLDVPIFFDLGFRKKGRFEITVSLPGGSTVRVPPLSEEGFGSGGKMSLSAGELYSQPVLLNERYDFAQPGDYDVQITLPGPIRTNKVTVINSPAERFRFHIAARDEARLRRTCELLVRPAISAKQYEEQANAALALSYVVDPVAVPFLREVLLAGTVDNIVIAGLRRIGSGEAKAVLEEASRSSDAERAALARDAIRRIGSRPR